jgi:hypothetical protein
MSAKLDLGQGREAVEGAKRLGAAGEQQRCDVHVQMSPVCMSPSISTPLAWRSRDTCANRKHEPEIDHGSGPRGSGKQPMEWVRVSGPLVACGARAWSRCTQGSSGITASIAVGAPGARRHARLVRTGQLHQSTSADAGVSERVNACSEFSVETLLGKLRACGRLGFGAHSSPAARRSMDRVSGSTGRPCAEGAGAGFARASGSSSS